MRVLATALVFSALLAVVCADGAGRDLLQDNFGVKTKFRAEAPSALQWSAGAVTAASAPASFRTKAQVTGPSPPSLAVGVNPTGGYAEVYTKTRVDATLPRASLRARASLANTFAMDASAGTKILPDVALSTKIRPTVPITMPVGSAGGTILPPVAGSMVVNPRQPPPPAEEPAAEEPAEAGPPPLVTRSIRPKRHLLQDNFGVKTKFRAEAPSALQWSAGAVTAASAPASFRTKAQVTGPSPPSLAVGVNPTGGYAEVYTKTRVDATLPRASLRARASLANTFAMDASAGTKILPDVALSTKIRPTVPITMPVGSAGGTILPPVAGSMVVNPRQPPPPAEEPAAEEPAEAGPPPLVTRSIRPKRHLLNSGYEHLVTAKAPSTPTVKVAVKPPPGVFSETVKVRSEKPSVEVLHKEPGALISATGSTKVIIEPQRKFPVGGKGTWGVVNLSRGPSTFTTEHSGTVDWPKTSAVAYGNNPLTIASDSQATMPNPNKYTSVSVTPQPGDRPDGFIQQETRAEVPLGRHLLNSGYEHLVTAKAPSTPTVKVAVKPPPGVFSETVKVRSEKPSVEVLHKEPGALISATGSTKVIIEPQRKFPVGGKGTWGVVNLSRGPSTFTTEHSGTVDWPKTSAVAYGNNPLTIASDSQATMPNPNKYTSVSVTPQPGDRPDGFIQQETRAEVPLGK